VFEEAKVGADEVNFVEEEVEGEGIEAPADEARARNERPANMIIDLLMGGQWVGLGTGRFSL